MGNLRWFAYVLLLAAAFVIGLLGTISASNALTKARPQTITPTVPASAPAVTASATVEC